MMDNRKFKRFTPPDTIEIVNRETGERIGTLANLSTDGAMLITSESVKPAATLPGRLTLDTPIMGHKEIALNLECRWCRRNVSCDRWEAGFRISAEGESAYVLSYLVLGFKLCGWGDPSIRDVKTVELTNRRKSVRFDLEKELPVFEQHTNQQLGTVADISADGLRLFTQEPVQKGDLIHCRVKLPRKVFQREYLVLTARCRWARGDDSSGRFESGHEFEQISKQDAALVLHLMINYGQPTRGEKKILVVG